MLYMMVLIFESLDETLKCDHSSESHRAVISYGTVYYSVKVGLTLECVHKILNCDHSNESY